MRWAALAVGCTSLIAAKESDFLMENDGFAVIHTFTLTGGKICRKLDRYASPDPVAWNIRSEWNSIHLGPADDTGKNPSVTTGLSGGCQRGISQSTLVGPLKKGKWKIHSTSSVSIGKTVAFSERREIREEKKQWIFNVEKPAIASVLVYYFSNTTGQCREFVPLIMRVEAGKDAQAENTVHVSPGVLRSIDISRSERCRAMPQTIAEGTLEIMPGKYRVSGNDIKRVSLYLQQ